MLVPITREDLIKRIAKLEIVIKAYTARNEKELAGMAKLQQKIWKQKLIELETKNGTV